MASLQTGTGVQLSQRAMLSLVFPPPSPEAVVVVHTAALRAPHDRHTQVAHVTGDVLDWMGALGEDLLTQSATPPVPGARGVCGACLLGGSRLWDIVRPGALVQPGVARPMSTVYDGSDLRPWLVIGETAAGDLIAAPLNDPKGNPKWWTPVIAQGDMTFAGNLKDAQVELAHLWTLPAGLASEGAVAAAGAAPVEAAIRSYFNL